MGVLVPKQTTITIVSPVFNDWTSATSLLQDLKSIFLDFEFEIAVLFVDDGSTDTIPDQSTLSGIFPKVEVLKLNQNVGHQRAILEGMKVASRNGSTHVLVMDADGEDSAAGVSLLIQEIERHPTSVVVARRGLRTESPTFQVFYRVHKALFRTLVGKSLDFGNFCVIPSVHVQKLSLNSDSAGSLPAALLRLGAPILRVRVDRGPRYAGQSKMSFEKLVAHSFASLAVFTDLIMVRLTIISLFSFLVSIIGRVTVVLVRFLNPEVTPGWATAAVGIILVLSLQVLSFVGLGTLLSLNLASLKSSLISQSNPPTRITENRDSQ
jgi:glycosyltransferase involved in cell wall biosynthesis